MHARLEIGVGLIRFFLRDVLTTYQTVGEQLTGGGVLVYMVVHHRLGVAGLITFVVPHPPVTDHVDDHILFECLTEGQGQPAHSEACFGIVAVDVEDGGLHHLGHIGAVHTGTC